MLPRLQAEKSPSFVKRMMRELMREPSSRGEVIVEMVDQWHYGVNRGQNPLELIVFYAGTPNQALAIKQDPIQ